MIEALDNLFYFLGDIYLYWNCYFEILFLFLRILEIVFYGQIPLQEVWYVAYLKLFFKLMEDLFEFIAAFNVMFSYYGLASALNFLNASICFEISFESSVYLRFEDVLLIVFQYQFDMAVFFVYVGLGWKSHFSSTVYSLFYIISFSILYYFFFFILSLRSLFSSLS